MNNWKKSLSNLTGNTTARIIPQVKKVVFTAVAVTALSFGIYNTPMASSGSETTTVYYVYFNDEYIGTVSDKKVVDKVANEKLEEMKENFNGIELSTGSQLKYIPEQVFRSSANVNNKQVVNELKQKLTVQADAAAINVGGENVVYVDSQKTAEAVIKNLKLQYVNEDQLTDIEARKKDPSIALPSLQENETRILDLKLSKEVSFTEAQVTPDKLMSLENAIKFLQTGTLEQKKYQVQEGDVLGSIANGHGLTLQQMVEINPGLTEDSVLQIGQEVNITVQVPFLEVTVEKEALLKEGLPYTTETVEDASLPKGENRVKQPGTKWRKASNL
ncbi:LysM peptidoglycan-binding domain-containing protein [Bacillus sp. T3]|uniref:LysM peptidoglycan-binding domain-containing protein n=1 Tax=Bacillus sp. T3 TaxID=467262 RepID=UPI0029813F40|nr:LysM peptidoglycan-binding domain-containing protein [Bacillus sp. T3]